MENTCSKEKCLLWQLTDGNCPNYIESWWTPAPQMSDRTPVLVSDCAPKRTFLMIQELSNRLTGLQQSHEELRNESVWVQVVANVIGKNTGINLENFVLERQRLNNVADMIQKIEHKENE